VWCGGLIEHLFCRPKSQFVNTVKEPMKAISTASMKRFRKREITGSFLGVAMAIVIGSATLLDHQAQAAGAYSLKKIVDADEPLQVLATPSSRTLFVVEKTGRIRPFENDKLGAPVLDVHNKVSSGGEQGLLGAAFSPKGDWLYTNHTDNNGDTRITAYPFITRADESNAVELLKVDQPYSNHNGGGLDVTNDGVLWIGLGDGGSGGDPKGNGQNRKVLLGKILRIQPTPMASEPYTIPSANLTGPGDRKEIWAYGLRNPWRFDVDEVSKTVWIADVGQNEWEEINSVPQSATGANFGWNNREGTRPFKGGKRPAGAIEPIATYSHSSGGCSVTGGFVYRGTALPGLVGSYLYTDYCQGTIKRLAPGSRKPQSIEVGTKSPSSFGTDAEGELYVTSLDGGVYKLTTS
jgi:glucose/arabinose dehydrogenase